MTSHSAYHQFNINDEEYNIEVKPYSCLTDLERVTYDVGEGQSLVTVMGTGTYWFLVLSGNSKLRASIDGAMAHQHLLGTIEDFLYSNRRLLLNI